MSRRNITVLITVHAYGFYSIYVVNGDSLRQAVGTTSVLAAVRTIGEIYMFGRIMPVWSVVLVEFCFAYFMECAYGSPLSFKLACKNFDPKITHPVLKISLVKVSNNWDDFRNVVLFLTASVKSNSNSELSCSLYSASDFTLLSTDESKL